MYPGAYVSRFPDKPAVIVAGSGAALSYRALEENSRRLARYLFDAGLRRGDHIALLTANEPQAFEVYWAGLRSGLHVTAVNRHLARAEVSYILNDCGAQALVTSATLGELAAQIVVDTQRVRVRLAFNGAVAHHASYEDALGSVAPDPLPSQPRGIDMLYSSGTTGYPKGIKQPLPERQVHEPGDPVVSVFGPRYFLNSDTIYLSPAPIYHAAPLRFAAAVQALGGTVVLMERFDAEQALLAIERYRVTHSQWVPTMFVRMLKLDPATRRRYDLSSLSVAVHAGAPCPVEVKRAMMDWWGPILHEYYSSTEGNGVTLIAPQDWLRRPGSVGKPVLGTLHICADDGSELPSGQVGAVYFEREAAAFSYHNAPEKTLQAQHPEHPLWTTTGDIGYVDEDGFLYLTDRKAFMIISGGVNIYPQEIENCLTLHPKVLDAAVIGVPDEDMGESVKAVIQTAAGVSGGRALAEELNAYLRERIAHYKVPRSFDFVDELPRTPTGKLIKRKLRERYSKEPLV